MADHTEPLQIVPDPETLHTFHRQQLSAMLDGELSPDAAKFMLRRLEHDVELARCWERWQVCGEVLRGRADGMLPADFAARVAVAVQGPATRSGDGLKAHRRPQWLYWGGAGMAASLALVAAVLILRLPTNKVMSASESVAATAPTPVAAPDVGTAVIGTIQDAPLPAMQKPGTEVIVVAAVTPVPSEHAAQELLTPAVPVPTLPRPWPRATSSTGDGAGRFTVGYGASPVPMLDPFQPRWLPPPSAFWPEPDARRPLPARVDENAHAALGQN